MSGIAKGRYILSSAAEGLDLECFVSPDPIERYQRYQRQLVGRLGRV